MPAAGTIAALWRALLGKPTALQLASNDEIVELLQNVDVAANGARKHVPAVLVGSDGDAADFSGAVAKLTEAMTMPPPDAVDARKPKKMRVN